MDDRSPQNARTTDGAVQHDKAGSAGWLPFAGFAFGVAALIFVIWFVGIESILKPLRQIGWGFFWIVALNGIRHCMRGFNLFVAVPRSQRSFGFGDALAARLAGETINTIAFTGPLLGDAAKTAMLRRKVSLEDSATAVVVDEIVYYITSLLLILVGVIVVLYAFGSGTAVNAVLVGLAVFSIAVFVGLWWVVAHDIKPLSWFIKKCGSRWFMPKFLARKHDGIYEVECNVVAFHDERPRAFEIIVGLTLGTHLASVAEAFLAMRMLGLSVTAAGALIVEALTKAVNFIFFLIPGTVGAYEGGNGLIFTLLGYTAGAGVALALIRRGGILFWTLIGGIILLWRGARQVSEHLAESEAE